MFSVDDFYRNFGQEVIREVERQTELPGGLAALLERLGIRSLPDLLHQHEALQGFIHQYGVSIFLKVAQSNLSADDIERVKIKRLVGWRPEGKRGSGKSSARMKAAKPTDAKAPAPAPEAQSSEPPVAPAPPKPPSVAAPVAAPVPVTAPAVQPSEGPSKESVEASGKKWIQCATYTGPDRRSGVERRVGPVDRRAGLTAVNRNRRFGTDRRKVVRREEDRIRLGLQGPSYEAQRQQRRYEEAIAFIKARAEKEKQ